MLRPSLLALLFASASCQSVNGRSTVKEGTVGGQAATTTTTMSDDTPLPAYSPRFVVKAVAKGKRPKKQKSGLGGAKQLGLADDGARYFVTVYGYQGNGLFNLPRFTHTWALFIRQAADGLSTFTVSWDAADGAIGLLQPVKPGHNYSLQETFDLANTMNVSIQRSPIMEINAALYGAAVDQANKLQNGEATGAVSYKMTDDMDGRQLVAQGVFGGFLNCQHAVTDIVTANGGLADTGLLHGFGASDNAFGWLAESGLAIDPGTAWDGQLADALGI